MASACLALSATGAKVCIVSQSYATTYDRQQLKQKQYLSNLLQVVWTSGRTNCLHTDIDGEAVDRLKALITSQQDNPAAAVVAAAPGSHQQDAGGYLPLVSGTQQQTNSRLDGSAAVASAAADAALQHSIAARTSSWLSPSVHVAAGSLAHSAINNSNGKAQSVPTAVGASATSRRPSAGSTSSSTGSGSSSCGWIIIPDTPSSSFQKWAGPLIDHGVRVFADLPLWMSQ